MRISNRYLAVTVFAFATICARSAPQAASGATAASHNLSLTGRWTTSDAKVPRNRQEELETLIHPQFKLNQDRTFTLYMGRKYTGRWRLTGRSLRLDARKMEDPDKNGAMVAESATVDLTVSEDGKTLTQNGRGGSVFHRAKS
jgi:hypothetical protein